MMKNKKKKESLFPSRAIKISLIAAAVIFAVAGTVMKNQAFVSAKCAAFAASMGHYDTAQELLGGIDAEAEQQYYNDGVYHVADAMLSRGDYDMALERFVGLGDYSDSKEKSYLCIQKKAESLMEDGQYSTAGELLKEIMFFEGTKELYQECQYRYAKEQISKGEWLIGVKLLWSIRDYSDAASLAEKTALENIGTSDVGAIIGGQGAIDPEVMQEYIALTEKRSLLRNGAVAAGFYHTVGLSKDGRVLACGSNDYGQCDTSGWSGVKQVAAGAYHTVALLSDGTVTACGDNRYGQCDVGEWKNVVQICASDYNTAALLSDGTVMTCGYNKWTQAQGWSDIESIFCGSYALCGISMSGELSATHRSCRLEEQLADGDASTSYAVGLTYTGEVVFSSATPCEWGKSLAVYAGGETVGVITEDYKPSVYHRRLAKYYELPEGRAAAISLGATHFAVLYDDGRVYCDGENDCGQCDTSSWNLN